VTLNRFAWLLYLLCTAVAAVTHLLLMVGAGDRIFGALRYPLLAMFLIVCATFVFARPTELTRLHATTTKRVLLGGLLVIWLAYSALVALDYVGFGLGESLFGSRLFRLWYTSAYVWAFALESALLSIRNSQGSAD
jgi:hypothetical protein